MINVEKQVAYWRQSATEDWEVAVQLVEAGKHRHGLFFACLAIEKALKAHVCRATEDLAPRIHSLLPLAQLAKLSLSSEQTEFLGLFSTFNIEGRYPETLRPAPPREKVRSYMVQAEEFLQWLIRTLS